MFLTDRLGLFETISLWSVLSPTTLNQRQGLLTWSLGGRGFNSISALLRKAHYQKSSPASDEASGGRMIFDSDAARGDWVGGETGITDVIPRGGGFNSISALLRKAYYQKSSPASDEASGVHSLFDGAAARWWLEWRRDRDYWRDPLGGGASTQSPLCFAKLTIKNPLPLQTRRLAVEWFLIVTLRVEIELAERQGLLTWSLGGEASTQSPLCFAKLTIKNLRHPQTRRLVRLVFW